MLEMSVETFKEVKLSELFDWNLIAEIVVSLTVLKLRPGEEISIEDCSKRLMLEMLFEGKTVVLLFEIKPSLENMNTAVILSDFSEKDGMVDSMVESRYEMIELVSRSVETVTDDKLSKLFDGNWSVEIDVSFIVLKFGPEIKIADEDCSISLILEISLGIVVVSWNELISKLEVGIKAETLSDL